MATMAPSIDSMSSSFGIATISFDFSATLTWPSTRRWREGGNPMDGGLPALFLIRPAHRLAVDRDHSCRNAGQGRHPGDETLLEFLGVERGEDVAELIVRRRAIRKPPEPAQKVELPRPDAGDVHEALSSRQQAQHHHLIEGVDHLATLPRVRQRPEMIQKNNRFTQ